MRKIKGGIITTMFLISLLVVINPVSAAVHHVYSGQSIQTAINSASSGDTIYVHAGTYNENLTIGKDLSLIGDGAFVTTIDGSGAVISVNGVVVNISGFTVRNGIYGIYCYNNASGTITNNTITGNTLYGIVNVSSSNPTITNNTITGSQSGIYNSSSSPTITNNTITGNQLNGIHNSSSSPTITNNTITGNQLNGIHNSSSSPTITNNTITGNQYGIYNSSSSPTITNNTITANRHGIANYSSSPTITNNTVTGNSGEGIDNRSSSNPTITNNIISSNSSNGIYDDGTGTHINTYNDVWGNGTDYSGVTPGIGSISKDPRFVGVGNYHLSSSSPCIDAGTNAGVYTDMDGEKRPMGRGFDIGADEYYVSQAFANAVAAFIPVKNYHLRQVNTCLGCITENLPEDVPEDVQTLLDEMQEHINNANKTGNSIYANNKLLKALKCAEDIQEKLGITCPL